jgi:aspartate racemase
MRERGSYESGSEHRVLPSCDVEVHRVIYDELCLGKIRRESKEEYRRIINGLVSSGAQGIILGGTEIGLLAGSEDSPVPVFDTTRIHAQAAVESALA